MVHDVNHGGTILLQLYVKAFYDAFEGVDKLGGRGDVAIGKNSAKLFSEETSCNVMNLALDRPM
ncbi:MAG: hypothetical protein ACKOGP_03905, partial [Bacteroidota bacterium]